MSTKKEFVKWLIANIPGADAYYGIDKLNQWADGSIFSVTYDKWFSQWQTGDVTQLKNIIAVNVQIKKRIMFPDPIAKLIPPQIKSTERAFVAEPTIEIQKAQVETPTIDQLDEIKNQFSQSTSDLIAGFEESMKLSKSNYQLIIVINIIIVFFGIVLLSFSIYYSWISQKFEIFSAITAGLGIADFMALFFVNPQTKIRKNLADLVQMRMIYNAWINESYSAYLSLAINGYGEDNILKYQNSLDTLTTHAVNLIENNIGNDGQPSNAQKGDSPKT